MKLVKTLELKRLFNESIDAQVSQIWVIDRKSWIRESVILCVSPGAITWMLPTELSEVKQLVRHVWVNLSYCSWTSSRRSCCARSGHRSHFLTPQDGCSQRDLRVLIRCEIDLLSWDDVDDWNPVHLFRPIAREDNFDVVGKGSRC